MQLLFGRKCTGFFQKRRIETCAIMHTKWGGANKPLQTLQITPVGTISDRGKIVKGDWLYSPFLTVKDKIIS